MITSESTLLEALAFLGENALTLEARREKPRLYVVALCDSATGGHRYRTVASAESYASAFDAAMKKVQADGPLR